MFLGFESCVFAWNIPNNNSNLCMMHMSSSLMYRLRVIYKLIFYFDNVHAYLGAWNSRIRVKGVPRHGPSSGFGGRGQFTGYAVAESQQGTSKYFESRFKETGMLRYNVDHATITGRTKGLNPWLRLWEACCVACRTLSNLSANSKVTNFRVNVFGEPERHSSSPLLATARPKKNLVYRLFSSFPLMVPCWMAARSLIHPVPAPSSPHHQIPEPCKGFWNLPEAIELSGVCVTPSRGGVTNSSQTPALVEEAAPFQYM
jgi:hypothetical protein